MKNLPKPPSDLTAEAKKKWSTLQEEYGITDEAGLTYLTMGCRFFDRMRQAQEALRKEGMTQTDRFGQVKPHPCALIERDAASSMIRAFKALNMDVEPLRDKPGRPPGR
jgi:P27 family predicted phage terminase small subunit